MSWASARRKSYFLRQTTAVVCLFCILAIAPPAQAQPRRYRPAPEYLQLGKPDQEEGKRILQEFRQRGFYGGDYYLDFELRVMPRRGAERTVPGRMWGSRTDLGPISRVSVAPGVKGQEERLLIQNGPSSSVWRWKSGEGADSAQLSEIALFDRLADTDVTPFDLELSFLYWPEFVFEGVSKMRGRPAHTFLLYPPAEVAAVRPDLTGVRVYLDTQYHALVQAEHIGPEGKVLKTMSVLDLKNVDGQWIVKSVDLRDEATRNKTRFSVVEAAVGLDFSRGLFEPGMLTESIRPPASDRIRKVGP